MTKIFCIGFHKTGTSSLSEALRILEYRVCGAVGVSDPHIGERALQTALRYVPRYDAFRDNPWPVLFRDLDRLFPGSKFILTTRDMDSWIKSAVGHFDRQDTPMRKWIYGAGHPLGNEALYVQRHKDHIADALEYFYGRADDLLVLSLIEGEGWEKLCPFLDRPIPTQRFPHVVPKQKARRLHRRARRWLTRRLRAR